MRVVLAFCFSFLYLQIGYSQTLTGFAHNEAGEPIEYTNVLLVSRQDSANFPEKWSYWEELYMDYASSIIKNTHSQNSENKFFGFVRLEYNNPSGRGGYLGMRYELINSNYRDCGSFCSAMTTGHGPLK